MRRYLALTLCLFAAAAVAFAQTPGIWIPAPRTTWQWQLTGTIDQNVEAEMFDVDLFHTDASVVAALKAKGRKVVCYMSAGTFEDWRPDASRFPDEVKGKPLEDFPNERWLDIRRLDVLGPIMEARMDLCKQKGFDAVEPDNIDGFDNNTGFPLTGEDQLRYNRFLAAAAHARGLSIGLKNDISQIDALLADFDWALNEECFQYKECDDLRKFINAGKAVFHVEYQLNTSQFCPQANSFGFSSMRKRVELDAFREVCWTSAPAPAVTVNSIRHAASLQIGAVTPGQILSIFGSGLGPSTGMGLQLDASGRVATSLGGTRVLFDGVASPLLFVRSDQINLVVPYAIEGKAGTQMVVERGTVQTTATLIPVVRSKPGIFTLNASGSGQGAILNQDSSVNGPDRPAPRGSIVAIFASGEGQTNPKGVDGAIITAPAPTPLLPVAVRIGGLDAEVIYKGGAPGLVAGAFQVNARVPAAVTPGKQVPVTIVVGDAASPAGVTMAVQ